MLIGQSLLAPADGTHTVYGPWSPRQGDKFTAVVEVIRTAAVVSRPRMGWPSAKWDGRTVDAHRQLDHRKEAMRRCSRQPRDWCRNAIRRG